MTMLVLHRVKNGDAITVHGPRIERGQFETLKSASAVLQAAHAAADLLREESRQILAQQTAQAHQEGFAKGVADGMVAVMGTLEIEHLLRQLLADRMADVVEQCVRNLLGDVGPAELFQQRVRHLLRSNPQGARATLHVSPSQAHLAQAVIAEQASISGSEMNWLTVHSDEQCATDALVLETRVGFIDASIELTLSHARDLISRAVLGAAARLGL